MTNPFSVGSPHAYDVAGISGLSGLAMQKTADASPYPDDNPKTALGVAKPSISAVPTLAMFLLGKVMSFGAKKYGAFNYREKSITASTYYNAAMRHLMAYWDGQQVDEESGIDHRAHAMACLAIWVDAESLGKLNDDRGPPGALSTWLVENTNKPL